MLVNYHACLLCRYVLLEDEVKMVFGDDSRDRAGVSILEKLKQFIFIENNALPHIAVSHIHVHIHTRIRTCTS